MINEGKSKKSCEEKKHEIKCVCYVSIKFLSLNNWRYYHGHWYEPAAIGTRAVDPYPLKPVLTEDVG